MNAIESPYGNVCNPHKYAPPAHSGVTVVSAHRALPSTRAEPDTPDDTVGAADEVRVRFAGATQPSGNEVPKLIVRAAAVAALTVNPKVAVPSPPGFVTDPVPHDPPLTQI